MRWPRPAMSRRTDPPRDLRPADFETGRLPIRFSFLLLENFSLLSFSTAIETLRIANRAAGHPVLTWTTLSETGQPVLSSHGGSFAVDAGLVEQDRREIVILCGGDRIERTATRAVLGWLRRAAARGNSIGGLCTAAWALAEAGLLASASATIHWEQRDSFQERFPGITLSDRPFVIDNNRLTSAGGTSAIDLLLALIADQIGTDLARATAERMLYSSIHRLQMNSSVTAPGRLGDKNPRMRQAVALMEAQLEEPLRTTSIARQLSISTRQLERLFSKSLGVSPKRHLIDMRLDRSHRLLLQTDMPVTEAAMASGFQSASSFSKAFRRRFGLSPHQVRRSAL